ncbi:MAG TPA: MspA family porin [Mycobacterium sp.]|nr:MspA family porin [Mycobacterium sp.]
MKLARLGVPVVVCALLAVPVAPAVADTDPPSPEAAAPPPAAPIDHAAGVVAPGDEAAIESAPPATTTAPDGWVLTVGAKDEILRNIAPLTTAISTRDYEVSGVFVGSLRGPDGGQPPHGVLEVGYQIGCGIDMSTSQGVTLTDSAGLTPSVGLDGIDVVSPLPEILNPILLAPVTSGVAIGLKPGIINIVPVSKKEFTGADPWVSVSGFHVKIDGCVGESFIRSYAVLTHSTDQSESIRAYYGTTRKV